MPGDEEGDPTPASYASSPRSPSDAASSSTQAAGPASATTESAMSSRTARRDRVSVGSRMTRTVVVRPPYAARDELDFERRPRSGTTGTMTTGSDGTETSSRPGRPAGIQPPLHAQTADGTGTTRSHVSSTLSGTTHAGDEKGLSRSTPSDGNNNATLGEVTNEKGYSAASAANAGNPGAPGSGNDSGHGYSAKNETSHTPNNGARPPMSGRDSSNDASRWLAFTLPTKYRKMLDDYMARSDGDQTQQHPRPDPSHHHHFFGNHHIQEEPVEDASDIDSEESSGDYHYRYFGRKKRRRGSQSRQASADDYDEEGNPVHRPGTSRARPSHRSHRQSSRRSSWDRSNRNDEGLNMASQPTHMSRNNSQNPGWNSPWLPHAGADPENNIPGALHFPGVASTNTRVDGIGINGEKHSKLKTRTQKFRRWVVRSAFAPLAFRMLNLAFTAALLGVAVSIRQIASRDGVMGIMGSSTIFAIVISPLSIFHIIFNLYTEYFGSPIGVWKVRSKMFYTFTELIFICLWSGLLSLAFDDLFTSPAGCTAYTPNAQYRQTAVGAATTDGSLADQLCDRQAALVSLVFVGLILYVLVLIVSLFRIFAKISRIQ